MSRQPKAPNAGIEILSYFGKKIFEKQNKQPN